MLISALLRRLLVACVWVALVAGLAACGGPEITLTGTITDAYTGQPVSSAAITLGESQATADANGTYRFDRWNIEDTLQISANGYEPVGIALNSQPQLAQPTPPEVTLNTTLRPNTLSGAITDEYSGQPVAGALLRVGDVLSATTGPDGRYTLAGVPESFTITVSAPDYADFSQDVARSTGFDAALRPNVVTGVITDQYSNQPLAGVTIKAGDISATTAADGRYRLAGVPAEAELQISAEGYAPITTTLQRATSFDTALRPDLLKGTLLDAASGEPIKNATIIATLTISGTDVAYTRIDNSSDGTFALKGIPEQGYIQVLAPGYRKATLELKPGTVPDTIKLEPFVTRAVYITSAMASSMERVRAYFDLIDRTELNAIVIDVKSDLRDDLGLIYYASQVPIVQELGTSRDIMDIRAILAEAKQRGIYTIARVHIFSHDNVLADAKPEWAAKDRTTGGVFADYPTPTIRYAWLDPWNTNVWDYNIQLAVEAAQLGFDEINYDYIRFPSLEFSPTDKERLQLSRESTAEERYANIAAMLERSQRAINGVGAFLSVDVFGYTTWGPGALIGQNLAMMAEHTDYIMPMVYPSHYVAGTLGFDNPARYPYEIVRDSMERGLQQVVGKRAVLRPWLQDFTLIWVPQDQIVEYGAAEVRAQIKAVQDVDPRMGWTLYDSTNVYTEEALLPEQQGSTP